MTSSALDTYAEQFASIALANVAREFPNKLDHVLADAGDARTPRALHPAFYGSYDWHSCVHMHWLLARLWRRCPRVARRGEIAATFDAHLAPEAIAAECGRSSAPTAGPGC
jgi:hypothetical protein